MPVRGVSGALEGGKGMAGLVSGAIIDACGSTGRSVLPGRRNQERWIPASLRR